MKSLVIACAAVALLCSPALAGVVIEMEVAESGSSGQAEMDTVYAQGEMLRVDPHPRKGGKSQSVIFRDETLWIVDHGKKVCQRLDKKDMEELSAQVGAAMKEMEAQLANMPPEQRAMVEKMMKDKMPGGMAGMGQEAPPRRMEVGAGEQIGEYSCTVRTAYAGDEKVWEVCAAEGVNEGAWTEAMTAFGAMSGFMDELRKAFQQGPLAGILESPYYDMKEIGGLPVRVRTFRNGQMESEAILRSLNRQELEDDVFSIPDGYKVKSLAAEIKKGR